MDLSAKYVEDFDQSLIAAQRWEWNPPMSEEPSSWGGTSDDNLILNFFILSG